MTGWYILAIAIIILLLVKPVYNWYKKYVIDPVDEQLKKHEEDLRKFDR